jgi:ribosome-binding protein aMBF1 (putative translation factor)
MVARLKPAQIRGARGMLDWSMVDLARAASISVSTVKRSEHAEPQPVSDDVFVNIQAAFENAGLCFSDDSGEGIGIRLRRH